jgi:hypothetical protein
LQLPYRKPGDGCRAAQARALDTRIEEVPTRVFSVSVDFEIDDALA